MLTHGKLFSDDVLFLKKRTSRQYDLTCIQQCKSSFTISKKMQVGNVPNYLSTAKLLFFYIIFTCTRILIASRPCQRLLGRRKSRTPEATSCFKKPENVPIKLSSPSSRQKFLQTKSQLNPGHSSLSCFGFWYNVRFSYFSHTVFHRTVMIKTEVRLPPVQSGA